MSGICLGEFGHISPHVDLSHQNHFSLGITVRARPTLIDQRPQTMPLETDAEFWASLLTRDDDDSDVNSDSDLEPLPLVNRLHSQPDSDPSSTSSGYTDSADTPPKQPLCSSRTFSPISPARGLASLPSSQSAYRVNADRCSRVIYHTSKYSDA